MQRRCVAGHGCARGEHFAPRARAIHSCTKPILDLFTDWRPSIARSIEPNDYLLWKTPKSGCREIFNIFINGPVSPVRARLSAVDFANKLRTEGHSLYHAVAHSCRIRLRPILMTSLATVVGLLPMALKLESGSEAYAPLARVIIGGLIVSVMLTIFVVPAAYVLIYERRAGSQTATAVAEEAK